jgi:Vps23 core domain
MTHPDHLRFRLINLIAEDNAIEDTIYHLHRALNAGRIDLDKFLRVRGFRQRLVTLNNQLP